jgi:hypothetical protein
LDIKTVLKHKVEMDLTKGIKGKMPRPALDGHDYGTPAHPILLDWYNNHEAHPYPTKEDKQKLVEDSGVDWYFLCNWFGGERTRRNFPVKKSERLENKKLKQEIERKDAEIEKLTQQRDALTTTLTLVLK